MGKIEKLVIIFSFVILMVLNVAFLISTKESNELQSQNNVISSAINTDDLHIYY